MRESTRGRGSRRAAAAWCAGLLALGLAACGSPATSTSSGTGGVSSSSASDGTSGASSGTASSSTSAVDVDVNTTDQMWSDEVTDAKLSVFVIDGAALTTEGCEQVYLPTVDSLRDGGFYEIVADVTYLNGGVAGYVNYPEVKRVSSWKEVSPLDLDLPAIGEKDYGLLRIGEYADGDVLFRTNSAAAVLKDGAWAYRYDAELKLPDGRRAAVRKGVAEEDVVAGAEAGVLSCAEYFVLP